MASDRLVRLINDVLDIERIESGQITMEKQICDAGELMEQASEAMRGLARSSKVELSVSAQPISIYADPDRIVQVFTNLLSNSVGVCINASDSVPEHRPFGSPD